MAWLTDGLGYLVPFLVILTVLVFIHELGHYLVARRNGVRVETFSIGFGPELFGWNGRSGTRWKFSAIPLGGYVKMFGDADPASVPGVSLGEMTEAEKAVSFHHKRLGQRAAVVSAGPAANFVLAILLLAIVFVVRGQPFTPADVTQVLPNSAAEAGGVRAGDVIVAINGRPIDRFETVKETVELSSGGPMQMEVKRGDKLVDLTVTPRIVTETDRFGFAHRVFQLGIRGGTINYLKRDPASAVWYAAGETWNLTTSTLQAVGQMIMGLRSSDELSGPIGIVRMSGEVAQGGIVPLLWFAAVLSVNLGLINLFPIPVLDGGHLLFYAAEAIRGKPLGQRAQEYGFRLGLALVLTLMVFATWNDLVRWGIVKFIKGLVT